MIDTIKQALILGEDKTMHFDESTEPLEIVKISEVKYNVLYQDKVYNLELLNLDKQSKKLSLMINGVKKSILLKDELDVRIEEMGFRDAATQQHHELLAPMPGLILNILVAPGDEIKIGDNLLILEAMKMENILKASRNGIIKKLLVMKAEKVEKNQRLLEFE